MDFDKGIVVNMIWLVDVNVTFGNTVIPEVEMREEGGTTPRQVICFKFIVALQHNS